MIGRKKGSSSLTQLELELMEVLWSMDGPSTVQQVQEALSPRNQLAYTTVQTVLNTLQKKGKVVRAEGEGRAFAYKPAISKESILRQAVRDLADRMFGGSSEELVMSLIQSREVDADRIAELSRKLVEEESSNG
ncbi:BlaI/MecI/CopY family transcriptional regulator [Terriglobus sp. ADX1]|uniref:BlaI/MecI/CopY family transcriptional regulator n=1 Tax=Terriglobus sp. ADX1 TaxID=2794063 RepID=UPI002FE67EBF